MELREKFSRIIDSPSHTSQEKAIMILLAMEYDFNFSLNGNGWLDEDPIALEAFEDPENKLLNEMRGLGETAGQPANVKIKGIGLQGAIHGLAMLRDHTLKLVADNPDINAENKETLAVQEKWIVDTYNSLNKILQSFNSQEEVSEADIIVQRV